jgi:hypothetical protein
MSSETLSLCSFSKTRVNPAGITNASIPISGYYERGYNYQPPPADNRLNYERTRPTFSASPTPTPYPHTTSSESFVVFQVAMLRCRPRKFWETFFILCIQSFHHSLYIYSFTVFQTRILDKVSSQNYVQTLQFSLKILRHSFSRNLSKNFVENS